jgi:hypothetical protein
VIVILLGKRPTGIVRARKQDLDEVHGDCPLKSE